MGQIGNLYFEGGDKPTATELNEVYDNVAADDLQAFNLRSDFANRSFLDTGATTDRINIVGSYNYNDATQYTLASTSFTTLNPGGSNPAEISVGYTCRAQCIIRVHASGLMGEHTYTNKGVDYATMNKAMYGFKVIVERDSGANPDIRVASCCYSINRTTYNPTTAGVGGFPGESDSPINWTSFSMSGIAILPEGTVVDKVILQGAIGDTGNVVKVDHHHLQYIIVEN